MLGPPCRAAVPPFARGRGRRCAGQGSTARAGGGVGMLAGGVAAGMCPESARHGGRGRRGGAAAGLASSRHRVRTRTLGMRQIELGGGSGSLNRNSDGGGGLGPARSPGRRRQSAEVERAEAAAQVGTRAEQLIEIPLRGCASRRELVDLDVHRCARSSRTCRGGAPRRRRSTSPLREPHGVGGQPAQRSVGLEDHEADAACRARPGSRRRRAATGTWRTPRGRPSGPTPQRRRRSRPRLGPLDEARSRTRSCRPPRRAGARPPRCTRSPARGRTAAARPPGSRSRMSPPWSLSVSSTSAPWPRARLPATPPSCRRRRRTRGRRQRADQLSPRTRS